MCKTSSIVMFITLLTLSSCSSNKTSDAGSEPDLSQENKVCKTFTATELQKEFEKSRSKKLIINLYPLKASNNLQKNDFSLYAQYQDGADTFKTDGNKTFEKMLSGGSQNYIQLLKENKVERNLIPFGYYLQISKQHLNTDLKLCMNVGAPGVITFEKPADNDIYPLQDSCKCPPTCPCPPEPIPLLYGTSIKKIIEKVYSSPQ